MVRTCPLIFSHSGAALARVATLTLALSACGRPTLSETSSPSPPLDSAGGDIPELEGHSGPVHVRKAPRQAGDVWVHRFSGSYRSQDLILREEVVAERGDVMIVDFILEEGDERVHLRTEMSRRSERVISVSRMIDGEATPGSLDDFERMMAKTTFIPDQNRGRTARKDQTCLVGKSEINCELSEYKVLLAGEEATMTVARNGDLKRDIAGEITAVDGTVLYHAELIEMSRKSESRAPAPGVAMRNDVIDLDERE